jgi:hypothetical protein
MPETETKKCQSIYLNILSLINSPDKVGIRASGLIHELNQTERCQNTKDLNDLRDDYEKYIGKDSLTHILTNKITEEDERKAENCVWHYHLYTEKVIASNLDWNNFFKYKLQMQAERTLAILGIATTITLIPRGIKGIARNSQEWIRKQRLKKSNVHESHSENNNHN